MTFFRDAFGECWAEKGMQMPIKITDLFPLAPIHDGIDLLKNAILEQRSVFCLCSIARDFHVGAKDAEEILLRSASRGHLEVRNAGNNGDSLYVPKDPPAENAEVVARGVQEAKADLARTYVILKKAYREYVQGLHLWEEPDTVRMPFDTAFRTLRQVGILPITTGNAAFNHPGMVLLMEPCFPTPGLFIDYLRNPLLGSAPPPRFTTEQLEAAP
jgi:hypothetical protein